MFRLQVGLLIGLFAFSLVPQTAAAVGDDMVESILLSPVSKRYSLKSGQVITDTFQIINDGKIVYDFVVYARPYSVNDESYQPDFVSSAQNADAYKWVQFDQPSYRIEPGKTIDVKYTIRVPANATPGGHYGVLFAESQPIDTTGGNVVKRTKRVGAILYTTVDGAITNTGKVESVSVPFFQNKAPLKTNQRVTNGGNTDFTVTTNMNVYDVFGGVKFKTSSEYVVLPATTRNTPVEWPNPAWLGIYKVDLTTKFLDTNKSSTHYVLMVPIWVYMTLALLIGVRILYAVAQRKRK